MATFGLIEYNEASAEVRAIYDDIMATRKTDWINNFWKAIAHDPAALKRTWGSLKAIMGPGALDADERIDLCRGERDEQLPLLHRVAHGVGVQEGNDAGDVQGITGRGRDGERNEQNSDGLSG